jgi:glycosyltransferase involved in cell wall biosynthesis
VLVSGDGCTDASEEVVRAVDDPRVRWLGFPKAPGYGYANRARALEQAQGVFVAYLAPDDLWAPDHLARLVEVVEQERCGLAFSRPVVARGDGVLHPHLLPFDLAVPGERSRAGLRLQCVSPSQVLHTRALLAPSGGWDSGLLRNGDVDLWRRCQAAGADARYLSRPTVVRLPAFRFRGVAPSARAALHARLAEELAGGRLDLAALRWPPHRRLLAWMDDAIAIVRANGASIARLWMRGAAR